MDSIEFFRQYFDNEATILLLTAAEVWAEDTDVYVNWEYDCEAELKPNVPGMGWTLSLEDKWGNQLASMSDEAFNETGSPWCSDSRRLIEAQLLLKVME